MSCFTLIRDLPVLAFVFVAGFAGDVAAEGDAATASLIENVYTKHTLCDVPAKLSSGCMSAVNDVTVRSVLECTSICSQTTDCSAVSWKEQTRTCYLHIRCSLDTTCTDSSSEFVYFKKEISSCQNDGVFDPGTKTCICSGVWVGEECERYAYNCNELYEGVHGTRKLRIVFDPLRDVTRLAETFCQPSNHQRMTLIFRSDGTMQNNRTYEEFVSGYLTSNVNLWLGLDHMRGLIQQGYDFIKLDAVFSYNSANFFSWSYFGFQIGPPSSGYPISYTSASQSNPPLIGGDFDLSMINCLENIVGVSFSAWDHETTGSNCAGRYGAGWWYPDDCNATCGLLGVKRSAFQELGEDEYVTIPDLRLDNETIEGKLLWTQMYFLK